MGKMNSNNAGLRPLYSFEQLVIGPNNHVAAAACHEVINKPGEAYNPLFIYGPSGVGKTHLIQATAHDIVRNNPQCRVRYISAERFVSEILMAISEDKVIDMRKEYSDLDLLIIDDVQYLSESKMSQDELFHIFNNLHETNSQVILAADRPPNQLTALNKNIRSRLEWGLATDVAIPDEGTRLEILKKKQKLQGLELSHDMLAYVAKLLHSNVRELEGFLKRIHAYVTLSHQEINLELVQAVLREILPDGALETFHPEEGSPKSVDRQVKKSAGTAASQASSKTSEPRPVKPASAMPPLSPREESDSPLVPSAPVASHEDSFDVLLDAMNLVPPENDPPKASVENGKKNGHHKLPPAAKEPVEKPTDEVSLPPPSFPPSAPSNISFDILLESMSVSSPETATATKAAAAAPSTPPVKPVPSVAAAPPSPKPTPIVPPPAREESESPEDENSSGDLAPGHKEVSVVFFYPEGCKEALQTVQRKFMEVIKKHKLKFRMKIVHNEPYSFKGKINYVSFVDVCKANKVPVTVVIGPPPDTFIPEQDFYDLLTVTLDVQGVSLQLVNWGEISKDYRYLNLALDIALVRAR